jgi:hypothetical protein
MVITSPLAISDNLPFSIRADGRSLQPGSQARLAVAIVFGSTEVDDTKNIDATSNKHDHRKEPETDEVEVHACSPLNQSALSKADMWIKLRVLLMLSAFRHSIHMFCIIFSSDVSRQSIMFIVHPRLSK